jgi:hypothetical protein
MTSVLGEEGFLSLVSLLKNWNRSSSITPLQTIPGPIFAPSVTESACRRTDKLNPEVSIMKPIGTSNIHSPIQFLLKTKLLFLSLSVFYPLFLTYSLTLASCMKVA